MAALVTMPNPNGYDDLVKAGKQISGVMTNVMTASKEELRAYVEQNQAALNLARIGLTHGCRVPLVYSQDFLAPHMIELVTMRHLGLTLKAEGKLAEWEQRTNMAASIYLEILRLSHESVRGGLLIDGMVGQAIEQKAFPVCNH